MSTVQLNTRINYDTKVEGDKAFKKLGYNSSEVVRALWEYASRNVNNPQKIEKTINKLKQNNYKKNKSAKLKAMMEGAQILNDEMKKNNIKINSSEIDHMSSKELKEFIANERYKDINIKDD